MTTKTTTAAQRLAGIARIIRRASRRFCKLYGRPPTSGRVLKDALLAPEDEKICALAIGAKKRAPKAKTRSASSGRLGRSCTTPSPSSPKAAVEQAEHERDNAHRADVLFCTTHRRYYHQSKHCPKCLESR